MEDAIEYTRRDPAVLGEVVAEPRSLAADAEHIRLGAPLPAGVISGLDDNARIGRPGSFTVLDAGRSVSVTEGTRGGTRGERLCAGEPGEKALQADTAGDVRELLSALLRPLETPGPAAGVTDRVWELKELIGRI